MPLNSPHPSHPKYRADIDGLRAIAVLAVVAFHAFPTWLKGGFIGVDVFFVISGYLISTIIFESLDKGVFSFSEFYARRIKRIFPALILVLITCFAFGWFALLADEYKQLGKHMAAGAGFISNLMLWSESGYFDNAADTKPLLHLWSLGIEEQFYIVWPLLLWLAWKRNFNLLTITVLLAIASFVLNLKGVSKDPVATFYSPQTRFWELLSGSLLAWGTLYQQSFFVNLAKKANQYLYILLYKDKRDTNAQTLANLLAFVGLLLLAYGFWQINKDLIYPGKWALVPVAGTILLLMAGPKAWINHTLLSNKVFVGIGLISYPLYLWHWPLLSFARIVESGVPTLTIRILAIALSILLAWLTYLLIERPIRFGQIRKKSAVGILVLLMLGVGGAGYYVYEKDGLGYRNSVLQYIEKNNALDSGPHSTAACKEKFDFKYNEFCLINSISRPPDVILIGDSHGHNLYKGLADAFDRQGLNLLVVGRGGCLPFFDTNSDSGTYDPACRILMNQLLNFAIAADSIKRVVLTSRSMFYITGTSMGGMLPRGRVISNTMHPHIKDSKEVFKIGLDETFKKLSFSKKKIYYVVDFPELDFIGQKCVPRPFGRVNFDLCRISRSRYEHRNEISHSLLKESFRLHSNINVFWTDQYFCDAEWCYGIKDGSALYKDADHISPYASIGIGNLFYK
jgi:peptidoglycan/LPS O-acetylase OafA/YrhL